MEWDTVQWIISTGLLVLFLLLMLRGCGGMMGGCGMGGTMDRKARHGEQAESKERGRRGSDRPEKTNTRVT